jgi:DNA-binding NarL/FixJ family response regulator
MENARQSQRPAVTVVAVVENKLDCQLVENAFRPRRTRVAIVASAVDFDHALALLKEREPDVAVVSAELKDGPLAGYRLLRELHSLQSRTRAIILLGSREREHVVDAFRCGAHGVIFRDEPLQTLGKCIHAVHQGQVWANSEHMRDLLHALTMHATPLRLHDARGLDLLSKREADVAWLVADGLTNRAISTELGLSEHTVRNYLFRVFDKTGVSTRVELALYCFHERDRRVMHARADEIARKVALARRE